jgi:hypothetical protein
MPIAIAHHATPPVWIKTMTSAMNIPTAASRFPKRAVAGVLR